MRVIPAALLALCASCAAASTPLRLGGAGIERCPVSLDEAEEWHHMGLENARVKAASQGFDLTIAEHPRVTRLRSRLDRAAKAVPASRVVSPVDFGADPSGLVDSTAAMRKALATVLSFSNTSVMASGIKDCGGATLDLRGGTYLMSGSLQIPKLHGNIKILGGTLRAAPSFPSDGFLLNIGEPGCRIPGDKQGVCNEGIVLERMMFDGSHVGSCVHIASTLGTAIANCYFTAFTQFGLQVTNGHGTMMSHSWLSAYYWNQEQPASDTSIGVQVNGFDNLLNNVIVFSHTKGGVYVMTSANVLTGVHTWNDHKGTGILLGDSQHYAHNNRLENCYIDYTSLVMWNPTGIVVDGTFFLEATWQLKGDRAHGLAMTNAVSPKVLEVDAAYTKYSTTDVRVSTVNSWGTSAKAYLTGPGPWQFDFSKELAFSWIRNVQYSVAAEAGWTDPLPSYVTLNGTTATVFMPGLTQGKHLTIHIEVSQ